VLQTTFATSELLTAALLPLYCCFTAALLLLYCAAADLCDERAARVRGGGFLIDHLIDHRCVARVGGWGFLIDHLIDHRCAADDLCDERAPYCRFTAALLLLYCCFTAALLLLYCCFTAALLLLYCVAADLCDERAASVRGGGF
jgi:hypothetical protein